MSNEHVVSDIRKSICSVEILLWQSRGIPVETSITFPTASMENKLKSKENLQPGSDKQIYSTEVIPNFFG